MEITLRPGPKLKYDFSGLEVGESMELTGNAEIWPTQYIRNWNKRRGTNKMKYVIIDGKKCAKRVK